MSDRVAFLISAGLQKKLFSVEACDQLASMMEIVGPLEDTPTSAEVSQLLTGASVCITGWGTPRLTEEILDQHPTLRLIAHSAGTIHHLVPQSLWRRGLRVTQANAALVEGVAEFTVAQILLCMTKLPEYDRGMKEGRWERVPTRLLSAQRVGIVSASRIGREVIARLKPFNCVIQVYDPYVPEAEAAALGVELVDLKTLLATSDIVSLHAPLLPATKGMIGARELALLKDGALFVNTARAGLIDEEAFMREISTGRFMAALDVFHQEPLPVEHPLRTLPNVLLSPHAAAVALETQHKQGQMMVDEIARFLRGEALQYEVSEKMLAVMA